MLKLILIFITVTITIFSHSGGIDKNGGHYDKKAGEYHYHKKNISSDKINNRKEFKGRVVYVPDGDTIHINVDGKKKKVRFYGIDCPESTQAYGLEAKEFLMNNLNKNNVRVEVVSKDRYGRTVGKVYSNGIYLNQLLVKEGYAWWYKRYAENDKGLERLEIKARKQKKGLWKQNDPIAPWDYRKNKK